MAANLARPLPGSDPSFALVAFLEGQQQEAHHSLYWVVETLGIHSVCSKVDTGWVIHLVIAGNRL